VLVGADDRRIDHGIFGIGIIGQTLKHPLPDTALAPACMAGVDDPDISEPLRQISPRYPSPVPVQHRLDKQSIISRCHADSLFTPWQQMLDLFPLVIAQPVPSQHPKALLRPMKNELHRHGFVNQQK
jgi:hypothetical protein